MGKPASRKGDISSGHGPYIPVAILEGSPDVNINDTPAARVDDPLQIHAVGPNAHQGKISSGSGTVFINGKAAVRITDPVDCGGTILLGSPTVFIGD